MKKILAMLLAGMMVLSLTACGGNGGNQAADDNSNAANNGDSTSSDTTGGEAGGTFKIGGHGPLTGPAAIYGNAAKNGAQIAVDEINAEGGAIQFELNYEDDEHDPEKAENAYNALKDWGMHLSLSGFTSKPAEAPSTSHNDDRIFALTPSASATAVIEGKDNVYQMCFMDPNQGTASADYISEQSLGAKIAVIYQNDEVYSSGIYERFAARAKELGLEIVSATTFTAASQTDFSVQLGEAKNAGADLLYLPIYYTPASLILTQAKGMDYQPKVFGVDGMDGILTVEGFDTSLAEGVMLLTPFNADAEDERTQNFVSKYNELFGETPNQFAADAYDCVYAFKQAIEQTGATPDMSAEDLCEKMIEAFSSMTFDGLTGEGMTWTDGAVSKSPKGMVIENGAYVGMD